VGDVGMGESGGGERAGAGTHDERWAEEAAEPGGEGSPWMGVKMVAPGRGMDTYDTV